MNVSVCCHNSQASAVLRLHACDLVVTDRAMQGARVMHALPLMAWQDNVVRKP
jgi:hypothetical protein